MNQKRWKKLKRENLKMTKEWAKQYMEALEKRMGTYAEENVLKQDENSGLWYLRTLFAVYPDQSAHVIIQALVFELKQDVPQVEVIVNITNDVEDGSLKELSKAVEELNYISPVGAFGIRKKENRLYLRNCWPLDSKKTMEELVKETEIYYEMMIEGVQGAYSGLSKVWSGEITYEEAVQQNMLNRAND